MKKNFFLSLLFVISLFTSCSIDDGDNTNVFFEFIPIESVDIPAEFTQGETHTITVSYFRPSTCHEFNNFQYTTGLNNVRTVAVVNLIVENGNCATLTNELVSETFTFNAINEQPYTFRFWQGKDDSGQDLYLVYEVPVVPTTGND